MDRNMLYSLIRSTLRPISAETAMTSSCTELSPNASPKSTCGTGVSCASVIVRRAIAETRTNDTAQTWHDIVHGVGALGGGLALTAATFVFTARFVAEKRIGWAIYSAATGIVYFLLPWTYLELASLLLVIASLIGWGWISVMAWSLAAQPNSASEIGSPWSLSA